MGVRRVGLAHGVPSQPGGSVQLALRCGAQAGWMRASPCAMQLWGRGQGVCTQRLPGVPLHPFPRAGAYPAPGTRTGPCRGLGSWSRPLFAKKLILVLACSSQVVASVERAVNPGRVLGTAKAEAAARSHLLSGCSVFFPEQQALTHSLQS